MNLLSSTLMSFLSFAPNKFVFLWTGCSLSCYWLEYRRIRDFFSFFYSSLPEWRVRQQRTDVFSKHWLKKSIKLTTDVMIITFPPSWSRRSHPSSLFNYERICLLVVLNDNIEQCDLLFPASLVSNARRWRWGQNTNESENDKDDDDDEEEDDDDDDEENGRKIISATREHD